MPSGARFFVMSDVEEAAQAMVEILNENPEYPPSPIHEARFLVMSDVGEAAHAMVEILNENPEYPPSPIHDFTDWTGVWEERTLACATEREASCLSRGQAIYRAAL
ncbi:hypothetical protein T484DRAFT_1835441 [Baffinella frigidus]|nr:hypothetical protein T484DRAFT_1835441 [Cryptophyta sp. CCMP2293]